MEQTINTHQFDWCLSPLLILSMALHTFEEKLCCWCKLICHDPIIMCVWMWKLYGLLPFYTILIAWLFKRFNSYRVSEWEIENASYYGTSFFTSSSSSSSQQFQYLIAKAFSNSLNFQVDVPCLNTRWSLFSKHFRIEFLIDSL